jgi:penicillin-binding protein 2
MYPGFYVQPRTLRKYSKPIAPHVLGYVSEVDDNLIRRNPYYKPGDYIGKSGIEESYEKYLRGKRGVKIFLVDVFSRIKGSYAEGKLDTLAIQGSDIITGIDLDLQEYGENLMKNKRGSVVAIEPETGEVLSLISAPDFDPALLVGRVRGENFARLLGDTIEQPLFNRATMASYPPGSTFKPVNGLIGLQEKVITPQTSFECHQGYLFVACHEHPSPLSIVGAVGNSCNAYFCQTYRRVLENPAYNTIADAYEKWRGYLSEFGFGSKLGTDFANELSGFIPTTGYFDRYYGKGRWKATTVISMSIGQGEVGATPLQMANMTAAIANRGYFYTPHIVKSIGAEHIIEERFTTKHKISIDTANFEQIVKGMELAVISGTAAGVKLKDIIICGKTGTAQNPHGGNHSVFIAFAPKDHPKIAIAVYVENAGYGATYAAPIASLMIEKYLNGEASNKAMEKRILDMNLDKSLIVEAER